MLILLGESASGKSSIAQYLVNQYDFKNIITYTTRQPREGEKDGVDYYFISEEQFLKYQAEGFFAETAMYRGWYYGSAKKDYMQESDKVVAVLTPHGLRQIKKNGLEVFSTYIAVPRRDRLIKILERGDDIEESYRRNLSDVGQFDGIIDEVDLTVANENYNKSIKEMASIIYQIYKNKGTVRIYRNYRNKG